MHVSKTAALLKRANQQNILKHATGKAERIALSRLTKTFRKFENDLFENVLRTAGESGADGTIGWGCGAR